VELLQKVGPSTEEHLFDENMSDSSGEKKIKKFGANLSKDILSKVDSLLNTKLGHGMPLPLSKK